MALLITDENLFVDHLDHRLSGAGRTVASGVGLFLQLVLLAQIKFLVIL